MDTRLDQQEALFWTILRQFEAQALTHYDDHVDGLSGPDKRGFVARLVELSPDDRPLHESALAEPMHRLLESADAVDDRGGALVVQGLVLERVRRTVYERVAASAGATAETRALAAEGAEISAAIAEAAPARYAAWCGDADEAPFRRFAAASDEVLHRLDAVGEGVDAIFGERFGLRFADVVGDFVADLVPRCAALGMERRKVMSHLAAALMGI